MQARQPSFGERLKSDADSGAERPCAGTAPRGKQSSHDTQQSGTHAASGRQATNSLGSAEAAHSGDSSSGGKNGAQHNAEQAEQAAQADLRQVLAKDLGHGDQSQHASAHEDASSVRVPVAAGLSAHGQAPRFSDIEAVPPQDDSKSDPTRSWLQTGLFVLAACLEASMLALATGLLTVAFRRKDYDGVEVRCACCFGSMSGAMGFASNVFRFVAPACIQCSASAQPWRGGAAAASLGAMCAWSAGPVPCR